MKLALLALLLFCGVRSALIGIDFGSELLKVSTT